MGLTFLFKQKAFRNQLPEENVWQSSSFVKDRSSEIDPTFSPTKVNNFDVDVDSKSCDLVRLKASHIELAHLKIIKGILKNYSSKTIEV